MTTSQLGPRILEFDSSLARAIDSAVGSGIAVVDAAGRKVHVNDAFCRMVGWARDELIGAEAPFCYWPVEDLDSIRLVFSAALDAQFPAEGARLRLMRRDGARFPALLYVAPLIRESTTVGWVANIIDLSHQVAQEDALRRSEERLLQAQEAAHFGVWEVDFATGATYLSGQCERLFGLDAGTPRLVEQWSSRVHPDDLPAVKARWSDVADAGGTLASEYRLLTPRGEWRWLSAIGSARRGPDGKVCGILGVVTDVTDRKRQDELLARSQAAARLAQDAALQIANQRLDQFESASNAGFWEWGIAADKMVWSPGLFRLFGLDPEQTKPSLAAWASVVHPDDVEVASAKFQQCLRDHAPIFNRYRVVLPDGSVRWVDTHGRRRYADNGAPGWVLGLCLDVTLVQRADEANARLQTAMAQMTDALLIVGGDGRPLDFNAAFLRLFGFSSREEVLQQFLACFDLVSDSADGNAPLQLEGRPIDRALRGESATDVQLLVRRRDTGAQWHASLSFGPFFDSGGNVAGAILTARDVTERWSTEVNLRVRQAHQHLLIRLNDIARGLSESDQIRFEAARLVGELIGAVRVGYAEDAGDNIHVDITRSYAPGMPGLEGRYRYEDYGPRQLREFRAGRTEVNHDLAADATLTEAERAEYAKLGLAATINVPIVKDRRLVGIFFVHSHVPRRWTPDEIALVEDVADRMWAEVQRVRAERRLAEQAHALRLARDAANAANEAKSAFLANMSHEMRTPLNAIAGYSELLRRQVCDQEHLQYLGAIDQAGEHLLAVINDVLDLAKIESGALTLNPTVFALDDLLGSVGSLIQNAARVKGLALTIDKACTAGSLRGDESRLRQALLNMASNAVKFTEAGSIRICTELQAEDESGLLIRFIVADTGVGMSDGDLPRLFQPFEQLDASTTKEYGGTGLGLAITRKLARAMGGEVGVHTELGAGSTFWFTARLLGAEALDTRATPPAPAPDMSDYAAACAGARVLLVEDNRANRFVARRMLQAAGMQVDDAVNGEDALRLAREQHYDLVLMDISMPVMDGITATRRLRQLPGWGVTPVLAITGNAFDSQRAACLDAGMDGFLTKPIRWSEIEPVIADWLSATQRAARTQVR